MTTDLLIEDRGDKRVIWLNRPESLNSLRMRTLEELDGALTEFSRNKNTRALLLTGSGQRAFSAGGDIREMEKMGVPEARRFAQLAHRIIRKIEMTGKPVVSAVNGLALGAGCDLAFTCDICTASEGARFGMPSIGVGVITPFGGTSRLMQRVGMLAAKQLLYTGDSVDARQAMAMGLVKQVFGAADLLDGSIDVAEKVLHKAPIAFAMSKRLLAKNAAAMSPGADALEIEYYARCFRTRDQKEGARAFMEKREPRFKGE